MVVLLQDFVLCKLHRIVYQKLGLTIRGSPMLNLVLLLGELVCLCGQETPAKSVWDGIYTLEQAMRGERRITKTARPAMAQDWRAADRLLHTPAAISLPTGMA